MINLVLRNYQQTIIKNCRDAFKNGYKKLCCVLPCGAGKTAIFCYLAHLNTIKKPSNRVLILLHRKELLKQTIEAFKSFQINTDHINIAMIQSFKNTLKTGVKPYSLIIIDECHHATSNSFKAVLSAYSKTALIGFTATPARLDGKPLGAIFDRLIVGVDYAYLIKNKYLVDYDYFSPDLNFDFSKWKLRSGDFDTADNAYHLDKKAIYGDISKYLDLSKKTIIYSPTVDYSKKLEAQINEFFNKSPVAKEFNGTTPPNERDQIINDFRSGKIKILINVDLIGEGFDVPSCDCVFLLRATQSLTIYIQQAGRALRADPNNPTKRASIYDFVGNIYRFGFPDAPRVWSLSAPIKNSHKHETVHDSLIIKTCPNCLRSFAPSQMLTGRLCPFCNAPLPLNIRKIQVQKKELALIKKSQLIANRRERGRCRSFQQLKKLGMERGYKHPAQWAFYVLKNRKQI